MVSRTCRSKTLITISTAILRKNKIRKRIALRMHNPWCLFQSALLFLVRYFSEVNDTIKHEHTGRYYQGKDYHWMDWQEGYQMPSDEVPGDRPGDSPKLSHDFLLTGYIPLNSNDRTRYDALLPRIMSSLAGGDHASGEPGDYRNRRAFTDFCPRYFPASVFLPPAAYMMINMTNTISTITSNTVNSPGRFIILIPNSAAKQQTKETNVMINFFIILPHFVWWAMGSKCRMTVFKFIRIILSNPDVIWNLPLKRIGACADLRNTLFLLIFSRSCFFGLYSGQTINNQKYQWNDNGCLYPATQIQKT